MLGYSMVQVGPLGRVATGFAVSVALVAGGVVLERRAVYRTYAYALIAGGWAGAYVTTYAMRAVPAARVIESDMVAVALLTAVAAGMIAHSLRYRAEALTSVAYIAAYGALLLTPLSGFSLIAVVPLVLSLLVVSYQFEWRRMSVLGVVATYGLFAIRVTRDPAFSMLARCAVLGLFWVIFEAADIASRRRHVDRAPTVAPLFILNAVALIGAGVLNASGEDAAATSMFMFASGIAYVASAVVRRRPRPSTDDAAAPLTRITSDQGGLAFAAALVAWSIDVRFTGSRETLALLLETQLLVAVGMVLGDRYIRLLGLLVAAFTTMHHLRYLNGLTSPWPARAPLVDPAVSPAWTAMAVALAAVGTPTANGSDDDRGLPAFSSRATHGRRC